MRLFAELVVLLGTSTKTNDKLEALTNYFSGAVDKDKVWVIALFSGRRPKRTVNSTQLTLWSLEVTGLPAWLYEESYHTVGDLAETIALLLPDQQDPVWSGLTDVERAEEDGSLSYYLKRLTEIGKEEEPIKKDFIIQCWAHMNKDERFVFNKLITGGFRIGVSQKMIVNALGRTTATSPSVIAHRISGSWDPAVISFSNLLSEEDAASNVSRPYPFYLAYALEDEPSALGNPDDWQAEWKWDGIRGEVIKRQGQLFVWSRGEELMTERLPEYQAFSNDLPDGTVLDGEIIGIQPAAGTSSSNQPVSPGNFTVLPFAALQTRIGRKNVTKKQLTEAPVGFIAYDLLEYEGVDWREKPLRERRAQLEQIVGNIHHPLMHISPIVKFNTWDELTGARQTSRDRGSEGIMLKKKDSPYQVGRKRGDWWKWKIDPLVIDAVMVYAQKGHGRRSNLYTDYTFAVRDESNDNKLVTFTKAYSGLTDKELAEVDTFVKRNSLEKFGPVRTVRPELVFEIAFEGIAASSRHKSGVALRFPRINRWRKDKKSDEINTLEDLKKILQRHGKGGGSNTEGSA
ncbi:MAG: ATP-dependent DNA ligase [Chitinophagaceae bacterium]|nr:ATP-dependent DNA ligase [Chitinophagaceae bacterium]